MRIVVRGANWIGDAVMTIPAMRALRGAFPNAFIALHTRSWAEGIFRDSDFIDEIIPFHEDRSGPKNIVERARELRKRHFDLAVILPGSYRSAAIAKIAGIPRRFGYAKEGRRLLLTDPIRIASAKDRRHEVFHYLDLVAAVENAYHGRADISARAPDGRLSISEERREVVRNLLSSIGCSPGLPVVALGPGSTNSLAKRWPAERFASLSDMLVSQRRASVVLMGSKDEIDVAAEVAARCGHPLYDLTGRTNLDEAVAVLGAVDLFICNDMGLAHVAAAAGTPTLVIFGPTNPVTTRPFAENAYVVRQPVECSPCMLRECPIDHRCMLRIPAETVFGQAIELLGKPKQ